MMYNSFSLYRAMGRRDEGLYRAGMKVEDRLKSSAIGPIFRKM
jgi:hypothetical protein